MNELSNKYAMAALRERRATIAGAITQAERLLRHLRETILHLDATLRLFDPNGDPKAIVGKRPYKRVKLFEAGKLNRLTLNAMRRRRGRSLRQSSQSWATARRGEGHDEPGQGQSGASGAGRKGGKAGRATAKWLLKS